MAILNDNEFVETEGRAYVNPQTALDESNAFIENLRNTQQSNNQQIQTDTYNLGTAVPSNLGGLTSPTGDAGLSYFTSRYQTPQTNAVVENLRSVAQATALNQALQNEQEKWKKRYNDAYRKYQKSAYDKANSGGGTDLTELLKNLGVDVNSDDPENSGNNTADILEEKPGTVIPLTETSNKYQDPITGKWYVLTSPTDFDARVIANSIQGHNPKDGMTFSANGKVFRYDAGTDMWYQQVYMFGQGD